MEEWLSHEFKTPENYHLTFSYPGNEAIAAQIRGILDWKGNVAVVFNTKRGTPLPKRWGTYRVIDGDVSDFRPNDPEGVIVGLRFKFNKKREKAFRLGLESGFIQRSNA